MVNALAQTMERLFTTDDAGYLFVFLSDNQAASLQMVSLGSRAACCSAGRKPFRFRTLGQVDVFWPATVFIRARIGSDIDGLDFEHARRDRI